MATHDIGYRILGHDTQLVEVILDPDETVIAEAGSMLYMEDGIRFETRMGDGSESGVLGKLFSAAKRKFSGESVFLTHFTNGSRTQRSVAFSAPYPGSIVPLNLNELGHEVLCQKDAFLAAAHGTRVGIAFTRRLGSGFFGGEGFVLQKLSGTGLAFIHAGGTIVEKSLNGETLRLDTGCLVAFTTGIDYDIQLTRGLRSMLFGGEGLFLATLQGTGRVWIQSLPFSRLADRVLERAPKLPEGGGED
jgi:uncharacterized protein (TIGR00266 family)